MVLEIKRKDGLGKVWRLWKEWGKLMYKEEGVVKFFENGGMLDFGFVV